MRLRIIILLLGTLACKEKNSDKHTAQSQNSMRLNGVYKVQGLEDVFLVELTFNESPGNVNVNEITQEISGTDRLDWQSPWDEKYLDEKGEKIIGDFLEQPSESDLTRIIFFFHNLDFDKPLQTPYGQLKLTQPIDMPRRLNALVKYESPD
jgi:hypothetical protein